MLRYKLLYSISLLGLLAFSIMYMDSLAILLFTMIAILPIPLFLLHQLTIPFLSLSIEIPNSIVTKESDTSFYITIKNRSYFPVAFCTATIEIKNHLLQTVEKKNVSFSIPAHDSIKERFSYSPPICGAYDIHLKRVTTYSFLSLFKKRCFPNSHIDVCYLPTIQTISSPILEHSLLSEDSELFSQEKSGDDASEIFSLREFRDGDLLNRIHWKLSSKSDTFIVKEYSLPITTKTTIVFDVQKEKEVTSDFLNRLEEALSLTLSLSLQFVEKGIHHTIVWYEHTTNQLKMSKIDTEEQCYLAFFDLLKTPLSTEPMQELPLSLQGNEYIRVIASPSASLIVENAYES